jgi:chromosome partitioning protein
MTKTTIITVANQKGGVGKTTTAVTLAHGLAQQNYRILLVDLDSQGNVADSLGLEAGDDLHRLLFPGLTQPLAQVTRSSGRPNLDVIRSNKKTVPLKLALSGVDFREFVLTQALQQTDYDAILIDCPPSVDLFQTAALVAADYLLIPTQLDQLAVKGVLDVMHSLAAIQQTSQSGCMLAGVIPTFYDRVTNESHGQLMHLAKTFQKKVFPPIPLDTKCRESTRYGQTLWEYAPRSRALRGIQNGKNSKLLGGYVQVLEKVTELI